MNHDLTTLALTKSAYIIIYQAESDRSLQKTIQILDIGLITLLATPRKTSQNQ
ncbi:hypothetical protein VB711_11720 [Cronbergia sp. UHCC 0137]|uniref:hypothetical protein n=1 Tax=Cronbergia sp. UHCC 0137 TaxID=3110239 RepID=UPI002B1EA518|nr:hypothetical protein [Cronbergia sp. UHCC 0137]MEA5618498.1 hypothetical protein [Cronbergia sp. UHCC 0137]